MSRFWTLVRHSALVIVVSGMTWAPLAQAQDKEKAEKPDVAESDEEKPDIYAIAEDANLEQLVAALKALKDFRPTSREEYVNHMRKSPDVMKAAAEKILELEKDPKSDAARMANGVLLTQQVRTLRTATPGEQAEFYQKAKEHIANSDKTEDEFRLAMSTAMGFEYGEARDLAGKAYAELGELLTASKNAEVAEQAKILIGAGRRMNLVGKPLELNGKTIDGKDFDIERLKGKVVLVDFWATWCGPCLAEYPNILKNYETYHDKGFEVVGVSLDADRDALEKYVEDKEVPWTTLHDKEAGGRHPAANYYGILGIPAVILVNKEGKVISLNARGAELGKLLEQELGPADTESKEEPKEASKTE